MNSKILKALAFFVIIITVFNVFLYFGVGKNMVNFVFDSTSAIIEKTSNTTSNIFANFNEKEDLIVENNLLTTQVENLTTDINLLKGQLASLESQLESMTNTDIYTNVETVSAEVVVRNLIDWENKAVINVGTSQGIEVGMPVIAQGTLLGQITEVDENQSTVALTTSENVMINIPAYGLNNKKEKNGLIESYDAKSNTYDFRTLSQVDKLEEGDYIYTNGYQSSIPKGIIIGQVVAVESSTLGNTYKVVPTTDIHNIRNVEVVTNVN